MQLRLFFAAAAALLALAVPDLARAYPQFQFSTGNARCSLCHYSPAGGGLINAYGRFEAEATISRGGEGDFLHGLWEPPEWLHLGGDYRGAATYKDLGIEPSYALFPMQADTYVIVEAGDFSFSGTVGIRGTAREPGNIDERIISREHYVMWRPKATSGPYVRAGRFFAPFGLRLPDHTAYTRRYLGFHSLEETYNLSGGMVEKDWEAHVTAFGPAPFWRVGPEAWGGAGYYERRLGDNAAVGAQARVAIAPDDTRYIGGAVGKLYLDGPKLLFLSEVDVGLQTFDFDPGPSRKQLAAHLGLTYFPIQGIMVGTAVERYDEDLDIADTERDSLSLTLQYFFHAHFELMLMGKLEAQGQDYGDANVLGLAMLHYYL